MDKAEFKENYFNWLVEKVDGQKYTRLLRYLYERPYIWTLELDKNRVADAYQMRENYLNPGPYILDVEPWVIDLGDVSLLELFVAMAENIDQKIMWDEEKGCRTAEWFWLMMSNLGLEKYTDKRFNVTEIGRRVNKFDQDGVLFPCRGAHGLDLWMQMNRWFEEREVL